MKGSHRLPRAAALSAALLLSACNPFGRAPGDPPPDPVVTIYGSERKNELRQFSEAMAEFGKQHHLRIEVTGDDGFETEIDNRVRRGSPPDIALFPQPAKLRQHGRSIAPLTDEVVQELRANFDPGAWLTLVTIDGALKAVPVKGDLKSLVWYSPRVFTALGYKVPTTHDQFLALIDEAVARGDTPLCVGLESGVASGWPFTDWVEDAILRREGAAFYDRWVRHEVAFDDARAIAAARSVMDLWSKPGVVRDDVRGAVRRKVYEAGQPIIDGRCLMYRQANFMAAYWPAGTSIGEDGQVDAFYLPGGSLPAEPRPTLTGGNFAAAFNRRPETMTVLRHLASVGFANERARFSGVLTPNRNVDTSLYPTKLEQGFAKNLKQACPVRFDASDLMPAEVGSGSFWAAAIDIVNGKDVAVAFAEVETSWPKGATSAPSPAAPTVCPG